MIQYWKHMSNSIAANKKGQKPWPDLFLVVGNVQNSDILQQIECGLRQEQEREGKDSHVEVLFHGSETDWRTLLILSAETHTPCGGELFYSALSQGPRRNKSQNRPLNYLLKFRLASYMPETADRCVLATYKGGSTVKPINCDHNYILVSCKLTCH